MEGQERLGLSDERYRKVVYASDEILACKRRVHELYSTVPIDLNGEVCRLLDLSGQESILDIGCGTGEFLIYLRKTQGHLGPLLGGDISSGVFEKTKFLVDQEDLNIQFFTASILELPFPRDHLDIVSAQHMLSHVPVRRALEESKRVLSTNGKFIATTNSLNSYPHVSKYRRMIFEMMGWDKPVFTTTFFSLENMQEILSLSWPKVVIKKVEGELKIPTAEFLKYFLANMCVWEPLPTEEETKIILNTISTFAEQDAEDGYIIEPKIAGIALCTH